MENAKYWARRFKIMEDAIKDKAYDYALNLEEQFDKAIAQIDKDIRAWYQRFENNNAVSWEDAQRILTSNELKEFQWTIQDYINYGKENAVSGAWSKELENVSARVHISRLEALKIQLQQQAEVLAEARVKATTDASVLSYTESYYHTAYEVQKGLGVGWTMQAVNSGEVEKLLSRPWTTDMKTFRARCWTDKVSLVETVNQELTRMVATGEAPDKAIAAIVKKFGVSKYNAGRVVMTESAYFSSAAQKDCFKDLGVERYQVVATLDSTTCETCGELDSQVFLMSAYKVGATAPPFHPWCRCCTCPYFEDMKGLGERYARDAVTNERYKVPKDTTYADWKAQQDAAQEKKESVPQKKEYLTKKKLQAKIADADAQLEDLQKQFSVVSNGWTYDEAIKNFGSLDGLADGKDLEKLKAIKASMDTVEAQKAEWEEKLQEKLVVEQKKALTKEQIELEAQKVALQEKLAGMDIKTYSGIWQNDVTTADFSHLNIEGKKKYYENKFITETDPDLMKKYQDLYKQLQELETEGKAYHDVESEISDIDRKISKIQADLKKLEKGGTINVEDDPFSQERKDNALWFTNKNGGFYAADAYFDPPAKTVHASASQKEHHGFYAYTQGAGGHNRPLAGFEKPYRESGTGWEKRFYKGPKNVWINFEGKGEDIRGLTTLIEKSTYDKDVWVQSGQGFGTIEGFLGLPQGTLQHTTEPEMQQFIGRRNVIEQFLSVAVNKGGGAGFNSKPMKLNIYCPQGSQMLYASDVGAFAKGENEMILQRGGTYEITRMYWGKDETDGNVKKLFVDMELHPEVGYDLFQQDPSEWTGSRRNYRD